MEEYTVKEYTVYLWEDEIEDIQDLLNSKGFVVEGEIDRDQTVMLWGLLNQILRPESSKDKGARNNMYKLQKRDKERKVCK